QGPWKLLNMSPKKEKIWELYNIPKDMSEENNLAEAMPNKVKELKKLWEKTNSQMVEPLFK
ncbi:N-acetylgalactosamine-4-sulfatase, partial [Verrucomicrobia bacterium]|nr:N-acetylgalactosamine-4-sulfatase [Verrucomicrobiota bacterium]